MASKARPTAFSRFFILFILMAILFFGVQYALTSTDWGKEIHQELQESVPEGDTN
jgi:hypothetical protein